MVPQKVATTTYWVTLLTATQAVGKSFIRNPDGSIIKSSNIAISRWLATTYSIQSLAGLEFLISNSTSNQALILDHIKGTANGEQCWLVSESAMGEVVDDEGLARVQLKKSNFEPGGIVVLDRDEDSGDYSEWWAKLVGIEPGLEGVGRLVIPSSSGRVLRPDGSPVGGSNYHTYVLTTGRDRVESVGKILDARLWLAGHGVLKEGARGQPLKRSPLDVCTFSVSRRVFESDPQVEGGLTLKAWEAERIPGGVWDITLNAIPNLTPDEVAAYKSLTEREIGFHKDGDIATVCVNSLDLGPGLLVETTEGELTIAEYRDGDWGKLRCQTPFRDSESWAGYLNRNSDGSVFLFDVGSGTKHMMRTQATGFEPVEQGGSVGEGSEGCGGAATNVLQFPTTGRIETIMDQVGSMIGRITLNDPNQKIEEVHNILKVAVGLDPMRQDEVIQRLCSQPISMKRKAIEKQIKDYQRDAVLEHGPGAIGLGGIGGRVWPHMDKQGGPKDHTDNLRLILELEGKAIRYNEMSHVLEPLGFDTMHPDEVDNLVLAEAQNLCVKYGMPTSRVASHLTVLATDNPIHPMRRLLDSVQWDGKNRLVNWVKSLHVKPDEEHLRDMLVDKMLMSIIAMIRGYKIAHHSIVPRGVLVLVGDQKIGKTTWLRELLPEKGMFLEGHHLDPASKDSASIALSHMLVELGELESTFGKDIARLKAFISSPSDTIRMPYAPKASTWARRTVFCGSVNKVDFLVDVTGNTRFWPLNVEWVDFDSLLHDKDRVQVWAEVDALYKMRVQELQERVREGFSLSLCDHGIWWLSDIEESLMLEHTRQFEEENDWLVLMHTKYDIDAPKEDWRRVTISDVMSELGIGGSGTGGGRTVGNLPTTESKRFRAALRRLTGQRAAIMGRVGGIVSRYYVVPPIRDFVESRGEEPSSAPSAEGWKQVNPFT